MEDYRANVLRNASRHDLKYDLRLCWDMIGEGGLLWPISKACVLLNLGRSTAET